VNASTGTKPTPAAPAARPASPSAPAVDRGVVASQPDGGMRVFASPLARRLAGQAGIDLSRVKGSGPHGRVVKSDIDAAIGTGAAKATPSPAPVPAIVAPVAARPASPPVTSGAVGLPHTLQPHSSMRKAIARRLSESKQQVPHFYLTIDCEIDALLKLRAELNAKAPEKDGFKLSVNDFVIRAAAQALRKVPAANASWSDEGTVLYSVVDISVAVAIPGGLITPIIKAADTKGLAVISNEMKSLARKAKDGKLKPEEFQGGTFSISNLGMFGIKEFAAVINPPQGCILAIGAGEQRPVVKAGALAIATVMSATLSVDHRVVDGAIGAEFLAAFRALVEDPVTMLL
jgi:pyruvate dehydrogenase E2 component (dihydrolipoamide acetyltransferase)